MNRTRELQIEKAFYVLCALAIFVPLAILL